MVSQIVKEDLRLNTLLDLKRRNEDSVGGRRNEVSWLMLTRIHVLWFPVVCSGTKSLERGFTSLSGI